jgi:hypothetical protein
MAEFIYSDIESDDDILFEAMLRQAVIKSHMKELAELPSDEELRKMYTFSERHNKRMRKLFASDRRRDVFIVVRNWSKVAAVVVCIMTTVLFGILLTSSEVRAAVRETVTSWFGLFERFESTQPYENFVERDWSPEYLPIGFILIDSIELGEIKFFEYVNADGVIIDFSSRLSDSATYISSTDAEHSIISLNGVDYHLFLATDDAEYKSNSVVWDMQGYRFTIAGVYDIDELLEIAVSVQVTE